MSQMCKMCNTCGIVYVASFCPRCTTIHLPKYCGHALCGKAACSFQDREWIEGITTDHVNCKDCLATFKGNDKPMCKFYMVVVDGQAPNARYQDIELARKEAERMAIKAGNKAYVLEAIDVCAPVGQVQWAKLLPSGA